MYPKLSAIGAAGDRCDLGRRKRTQGADLVNHSLRKELIDEDGLARAIPSELTPFPVIAPFQPHWLRMPPCCQVVRSQACVGLAPSLEALQAGGGLWVKSHVWTVLLFPILDPRDFIVSVVGLGM